MVQLNAAPYIKGTSSGTLSPADILIRTNSSKIQVQIHKELITRFIALFIEARGGDISASLNLRDITSVININSILVSPVFPPMIEFPDERDVIFNVKIPTVDFSFNGNSLKFILKMFADVATYNTIDRR